MECYKFNKILMDLRWLKMVYGNSRIVDIKKSLDAGYAKDFKKAQEHNKKMYLSLNDIDERDLKFAKENGLTPPPLFRNFRMRTRNEVTIP